MARSNAASLHRSRCLPDGFRIGRAEAAVIRMIRAEGNQPVFAVDLQNRSVVLYRERNECGQRAGSVGDPDAAALADALGTASAQRLRLQRDLSTIACENIAPADLHPSAVF